jgi:hypothetical protein
MEGFDDPGWPMPVSSGGDPHKRGALMSDV